MKIISIEIGRDKANMMIIVNGKLNQSIQIPNDYSHEDLAELVYKECSNLNNMIVCENYHYGVSFWDNLKVCEEKYGEMINTIIKKPTLDEIKNYAYYFTGKSYFKKLMRIVNYDTSSQYLKMENDKIIDELDNFDLEMSSGIGCKLKLVKKDEKIQDNRAYCLLQVFEYID